MPKSYRPQLVLPLLGALLGYLLLHPYTMAVYTLAHLHRSGKLSGGWQWNDVLGLGLTSFKPSMIPMAVPFALLGGLTGFLFGIIIEKRKRLLAAEYENQKKKVALETLDRLMVTLSHYLLNANMIIGGTAKRAKRATSSQDLFPALEAIGEQARKIDAVINALKKITEVRTSPYASGGQAVIIDITKELEDLLSKEEEGNIKNGDVAMKSNSACLIRLPEPENQ